LILVRWVAFLCLATCTGLTSAQDKRTFDFADLAAIKDVSDPQIAPAGDWVAYVVRSVDVEQDTRQTDLWMVSWDGKQRLQLTFTEGSESMPRFSPDGRYLAFLSSRLAKEGGKEKAQIWLLDRAGGEGRKLTDFPGGVGDYAWSPDSRRLAVIASDPDPDEVEETAEGKDKTPPPIVVDRYQFKKDRTGYLRRLRNHLYLYDLASGQSELLTPGEFDESSPSWSPDGTLIAFFSKRDGDPDRNDNRDLFLMEARAGATPRQLTSFPGDDGIGKPATFSPDGKNLAYLQGTAAKYVFYDQAQLAVIPIGGGEPRFPLEGLDRSVASPQWSDDGKFLWFLLEDDRNQVVARVPASGGRVERVAPASGVTGDLHVNGKRVAALVSTPHAPPEIMAVENGTLRPLTAHNAELLGQIELGSVEGIKFTSGDGTEVHAMLIKPPGYQPGRRYPTIAYIHGGPVAQDGYEFDYVHQTLAAHGYVVVAPNYRGSSGRGFAFTTAIEADWGNLEVQDVLAAVDYLVEQGIANPERLGIGGWSYGGMTTNYTIARDPRFKAAVSGAGISNVFAGYGTDQYIRQYENEIGLPWKDTDRYLRVSYPFFHADRISTPTLFLCGEKDFNVPLLNSEQMYQALQSLGVETQLVIYPGQSHALSVPSYLRDRMERYVAWFDRFLK
jgi:dipeptidyl aminopeptidase/acylaminoacyl peptidase